MHQKDHVPYKEAIGGIGVHGSIIQELVACREYILSLIAAIEQRATAMVGSIVCLQFSSSVWF